MNKYKLCELVFAIQFKDTERCVKEMRENVCNKLIYGHKDGVPFIEFTIKERRHVIHVGDYVVVSASGLTTMSSDVFEKNYMKDEEAQ